MGCFQYFLQPLDEVEEEEAMWIGGKGHRHHKL